MLGILFGPSRGRSLTVCPTPNPKPLSGASQRPSPRPVGCPREWLPGSAPFASPDGPATSPTTVRQARARDHTGPEPRGPHTAHPFRSLSWRTGERPHTVPRARLIRPRRGPIRGFPYCVRATIEDPHAALPRRDLPSLAHLFLGVATPTRKPATYGKSLSRPETSGLWEGRLHAAGTQCSIPLGGLQASPHGGPTWTI